MEQSKHKPKSKGKSGFRKMSDWLHLWLGISAGLVVVLLGLTGCIFVFQKEISDIVYRKEINISAPKNANTLPLSKLKNIAEKALGNGVEIGFITAEKNPNKTWGFGSYKAADPNAFWYFNSLEYYKVAQINPYTGQVTLIIDYKYEFFNVIKMLHWSLLINHPIGQQIIGWSTFIFVILLITGMILWWPKNLKKSNVSKSFNIRWRAKFKRLNYDLHNVPGFYAMLIALVLALTGMIFAFTWFQSTVYAVASLSTAPPENKYFTSDTTKVNLTNGLDLAFQNAKKSFPSKDRIGITPAIEKTAVIYAAGYKGNEIFYNYDELQLDQYTGEVLSRKNFKDKNAGEKIIEMNYDIHVGAALGLPGKIIAFFASFIAMTLPISGFIIWWGKKKKNKSRLNLK